MYQIISEHVAVAGVYDKSVFSPKKFLWHRKQYPIEQITFIADTKDAGVVLRMYSVVSQGNAYRIQFNRTTERWTLMEVWCEG